MTYVKDQSFAQDSIEISIAEPKDYFTLLKPRVMYLVVLTALAGIMTAPGNVHGLIGFFSLLAIAEIGRAHV